MRNRVAGNLGGQRKGIAEVHKIERRETWMREMEERTVIIKKEIEKAWFVGYIPIV